jgi:hypothetical protein
MLRTTLAIVLPKIFMLAWRLRVLKCLLAFQSILMNTTLADIFVIRSSDTSGLCSVAAVFQGLGVAAAIWVAEGMRGIPEMQS